MSTHFKDEILDKLAQKANVAQFISYSPKLEQRYCHVNGEIANCKFDSIESAIKRLISRASEQRVNVRSFDPEQPKGHPFKYGLETVNEVLDVLKTNSNAGLYSIVNETIEVNDGGVSGVALGNVVEFTPGDTPKGVEKGGVCRLPRDIALNILETVYGFTPEIQYPFNERVEFSIHPMSRGIKMENTIIWELETFEHVSPDHHDIEWPNNFSKIIGDKAFGLLIANNIGLPVPQTTVISRKVAPFTFGLDTGMSETWIRTAPIVRTPGKFSTFKGWVDPFKLMADEDPNHDKIASVLSQQSVKEIYSGSLLTNLDKQPFIEGTMGRGDLFMIGEANAEIIPSEIEEKIKYLFDIALKRLGAIEMEWVYDGLDIWIVQLHKSKGFNTSGTVIVEGNPESYVDFDVNNGLEGLRSLISQITAQSNSNVGIKLLGNIGITSHMGDVLRKASIPSIIQRVDN